MVKEPKRIDFVIKSKPLTDADRKEISEFIRDYKSKLNNEKSRVKTSSKTAQVYSMKSLSLSEMKDKYIGKIDTEEREKYEYELRMDILGRMIKTARQERNLTQEQLGELVGVKKSQISKLESSANSATIETIIKVFKALKAEINFNVTIEKQNLQLS